MKSLQNLRVLDLSKMLPGNYCSMLLADHGAEVIKIDLPDRPEPVRFFQPQKEGMSYWHMILNRGKKSITLDYRSKKGREVFWELVKTSDILLEAFRPGQLDKWGIGYDILKEINPQLIYCAISGYGKKNKAAHAAHDLNITGLLGSNYEEGSEPFVGSVQIAGLNGAMHAAFGILTAVNARMLTGKGQYLDVSLMRTAIAMMPVNFSNYRGFKETGIPMMERKRPNYTSYRTKDGKYMMVGSAEFKFWQRLCEILGIVELQDKLNDVAKKEELFDTLGRIFLTKTRSEWEETFKNEDICVTGVYSFLEAAENGCFEKNGMLAEFSDEKLGKYQQLQSPVVFSETPADVSARATYSGENNEGIFSSLGLTKEEMDDLKKNKII